jgi:gamma-glutamylcyclotransferase (GGCT)/AIG2-like uncharacterized protein YtfP
MKHLLCFGSLRRHSKRGFNFGRFGKGTQTFIKEVKLNYFEMYAACGGAYPTICEGNGTIICELHEVEDEAFNRIQAMEAGANYQEKIVDIDGVLATIFVWSKDEIVKHQLPRIESGDWN